MSAKEKEINEAKVIAFLKTNTRGAAAEKFGISISRITALRKKGKIKGPSGRKNSLL